jgi:hypothetical protein
MTTTILPGRPLPALVFASALFSIPAAAVDVIINEIDADQPSTDTAEFIELYDGGVGNTSLTGYFLVLFNGNGDRAYAVYDLAGKTTSATGYFVAGNTGVPNNGLTLTTNALQNGNDSGAEGEAVALCTGAIADIVTTTGSGTPVSGIPSTVTVVDAVIYDSGNVLSGNDSGLLSGLGMSGQNMVHDSSLAGASAGRTSNGGGFKNMAAWSSFATASPGGSNSQVETLSLSFLPNSFDESDGPGASTGTVTRSGPTTSAVVVTLLSSDPSEAAVEPSVTIPAGESGVTFPVDAINDGWNDGVQMVTISATASLFTATAESITVNDEGDPAASLVVNEVHATGRGDANADGSNANFSEDEFVEIVNVSNAAINLSGWTLRDAAGMSDNVQIRHTFPADSYLNPGAAMVIFGGGAPATGHTAAFGSAWIIKANGNVVNGLSLNDSGDVVSLRDNNGVEMAGTAYGTIIPADNTRSLNRNPDLTGSSALVVHTNVTGAGAALFSPGTMVDGTPFVALSESLSVTTGAPSVVENSGNIANFLTISRPAPGNSTVYVAVSSSDVTEAGPAVPTLRFDPGVLSLQIAVMVPDDEVLDNAQNVNFTVAGEGYLNGTASLTVNDDGNDTPLPAVYINEVDCDQTGTDTREFVELYDGGIGNRLLDGFVLVFYNGATNSSYLTVDLAGKRTSAEGYFVVGNSAVPGVGHIIPDGTLQNGADAVAVYSGLASSFPNETTASTTGLVDAVVYGINQAEDAELISVLTPGKPQASEGANSTIFSLARRPNATTPFQPAQFVPQEPTPGVSNTSLAGYSLWAAAYPGLGTPDNDDDLDGLPNRLEFGLGTNPLQPNASGIPAPAVTAGHLRFTFNKGTQAGADPGTQFIPEVSTDLVTWSGSGVTVVTDTPSALVFDYTGPSPRVLMRTRVVIP